MLSWNLIQFHACWLRYLLTAAGVDCALSLTGMGGEDQLAVWDDRGVCRALVPG